jgi:6-phosphogluconolactonase
MAVTRMRAVEVFPDMDSASRAAASFIADAMRIGVAERRRFSLALSGGRTPRDMIAFLCHEDVPWRAVDVYQTDERIAPRGDPDRNLTLIEGMLSKAARIHPMPVEDDDLVAACEAYARELPERLDLVQLGIGTDGHTASLVPGCAALDIKDRDVAISMEYHGRRRMTLTYPAIDRAREVVWLVLGEDKREALEKLCAGDPGIPAAHIETPAQVVFTDQDVA